MTSKQDWGQSYRVPGIAAWQTLGIWVLRRSAKDLDSCGSVSECCSNTNPRDDRQQECACECVSGLYRRRALGNAAVAALPSGEIAKYA